MKLRWKREPGSKNQAPLSHGHGVRPPHDYVISHRPEDHTVSYRPPGQHHHVGSYKSERDAKAAAEEHAKSGIAPPSNTRWSVSAWGAGGPPKEWQGGGGHGHAAKKRGGKKSPGQLDREIAQSLASGGQPQLAELFGSPEGRRTFAREMCHEIQKQQTSQKTAVGLAARPFTVKHTEGNRRALFGRYATEGEARAQADRIGGWIEHEGRVVYGQAPAAHARRGHATRQSRSHASSKPPSWEEIAKDYKRRAKAAREAGGRVKTYPDGSIVVQPTKDADEFFFQDWQADEFREGIEYKNPELLQHVSFEDLVLAQSQEW
ncbi:MAG TPA: hypothetical protein VLE97_07215 [Gaiellaceae bacterium]|nr:hypothetical protein [Gaiellaceae bacterium]